MWIRVLVLFCLLRPRGGKYIFDGDSCVIGSYPLGCDRREYLARFEVSFRVESICCNGPILFMAISRLFVCCVDVVVDLEP